VEWAKQLTHRSMEAPQVAAKKLALLRFRASALPYWASFLFPNRVGQQTKKNAKVDRFYGNPSQQQGGSE